MILSHTCYKEDHQLSDEILSRLKNENIFDKMNNFPYFVPISSPIVSFMVCVDKITFYGWIKRRCIISMINLVIFCKMEFSSFILLLLFWELKIFVSKKYLSFNSAGRCGSSSETLISKQSGEQAGRLLMWL